LRNRVVFSGETVLPHLLLFIGGLPENFNENDGRIGTARGQIAPQRQTIVLEISMFYIHTPEV
jgi:hypothetical protein